MHVRRSMALDHHAAAAAAAAKDETDNQCPTRNLFPVSFLPSPSFLHSLSPVFPHLKWPLKSS